MELVWEDLWTWMLVITGLSGLACAVWTVINRRRRKRLKPDDEGQLSRAAHSIGEAQWSFWKLSTWRWGHLNWSAPRMPRSQMADRRRERRRQRQLEEAAAARGEKTGSGDADPGSGRPPDAA